MNRRCSTNCFGCLELQLFLPTSWIFDVFMDGEHNTFMPCFASADEAPFQQGPKHSSKGIRASWNVPNLTFFDSDTENTLEDDLMESHSTFRNLEEEMKKGLCQIDMKKKLT